MMLGRMVILPNLVRRGEVFEVRVLVQHPMETGFRRDMEGRTIPLNIVDRLAVTYGGREVFRAELGSGIAANPFLAFYAVAGESGELVVAWSDDRGEQGRAVAKVVVA